MQSKLIAATHLRCIPDALLGALRTVVVGILGCLGGVVSGPLGILDQAKHMGSESTQSSCRGAI